MATPRLGGRAETSFVHIAADKQSEKNLLDKCRRLRTLPEVLHIRMCVIPTPFKAPFSSERQNIMTVRSFAITSILFLSCASMSDCIAQGVTVDDTDCEGGCLNVNLSNNPDCCFEDIWCVRIDSPPDIIDGTLNAAFSTTTLCHNCPGGQCPDSECELNDFTCTSSQTITFNGSKSYATSGKISGTALLALQAELQHAVTDGYALTFSQTVQSSVTLGPCEWERIRFYLQGQVGRQAKITHSWEGRYLVRDCTNPEQTTCESLDTEAEYSSPGCSSDISTITATVCVTEVNIGPIAAGGCPPAPPAN